jgi:hypothetical protein
MNALVIGEKLIEYLEQEIEWAENAIDRKLGTRLEIIDNAKQRMLGAASLCQYLGLEYAYIEANYEAYVKKLEKLF